MTPFVLAAALILGSPDAPAASCLAPDALRGIGRFESWSGQDPIDPDGWARVSWVRGVMRSGNGHRDSYAAGFQTVYGPADLTAQASLSGSDFQLSAWLGGTAANVVTIRVQDTGTGRYLDQTGAWQDSVEDALVQDAAGFVAPRGLDFSTEGPNRTVRVIVRSENFGQSGCGSEEDPFCFCGPDLCPTAWVDLVRLCAR